MSKSPSVKVPAGDLIGIVKDSFVTCGFNVIAHNKITYPFIFFISNGWNEKQLVRCYIRTISHGGKTRSDDEYRIQLKGERIELNLNDKILILGWWKDGEIFVALDPERHSGKDLGYSPSKQFKLNFLEEARENGFSVTTNRMGENIIGFEPKYIFAYLSSQREIHALAGENTNYLKSLFLEANRVEPFKDIAVDLTSVRETDVAVLVRKIRDPNFRARLLSAYEHHCAFCDLQLNIVEASHILPVAFPGSDDSTKNGICLCPNHHKAYDTGIIYFSHDKYEIHLNELRIQKLKDTNRDSKLSEFIAGLNKYIKLPHDIKDRPHGDFVKEANRVRLGAEI